MKLKNMPKVELEVLSYTDLTHMILKENKKTMNTPSIFKAICDLLDYNEEEYTNKIGDYYTSLTLDKRFVLLDSADWDLREHRSVKLSYDEDDDEETDIDDEDIEEDEEDDEDVDTINEDDDLDDEDESIGLTIVDEDEIEEEME